MGVTESEPIIIIPDQVRLPAVEPGHQTSHRILNLQFVLATRCARVMAGQSLQTSSIIRMTYQSQGHLDDLVTNPAFEKSGKKFDSKCSLPQHLHKYSHQRRETGKKKIERGQLPQKRYQVSKLQNEKRACFFHSSVVYDRNIGRPTGRSSAQMEHERSMSAGICPRSLHQSVNLGNGRHEACICVQRNQLCKGNTRRGCFRNREGYMVQG